IYSAGADRAITAMGLTILKTPGRAPQADAFCERLIGTMRRECLDWGIPRSDEHLRRILREWVAHYNRARPHANLARGLPEASTAPLLQGQQIPGYHRVAAKPVLGGLHHEYRLERIAE